MTKSKAKILVVDDNAGIRSALGILLPLHFSQVEIIPSPNELISRVGTFGPDVVLLDMNFHRDINTGNEGLYWLSELKSRYPDVQVVLFTAYADIALAVEGMKRGAADFIVKPWDNGKLINILENACGKAGRHGSAANRPQESKADAPMLWGDGETMCGIRKTVEKIASCVGLAFQIQDDILDVTSTPEVLGKPVHSDEKNEKTTYVTLMGAGEAARIVEERSNEAIRLLNTLPGENPYLAQLLVQLIHRDR